jgi:hypothetical protein
MPLNMVDRASTRRFEDGDDWIELRTALSKHDSDALDELRSNYRVDAGALAGIPTREIEMRSHLVDFNRRAFELLCVAWSLDVAPTANEYDKLDVPSGQWVDQCVSDVIVQRAARAEGKSSESPQPDSSPPSQPEEAEPTPAS